MWPVILLGLLLQAPAPPPDTLTEADRLRMENAVLQETLAKAYEDGDVCRTALAPHRAAENRDAVTKVKARAKAAIEAAHPCHRLTASGQLERLPECAPAAPPTP